MRIHKEILLLFVALLLTNCNRPQPTVNDREMVTIMTAAPGHFHAALVQKNMYPDVSSKVFVYGEEGPELEDYLSRIRAYNEREENPTEWEPEVVTGEDFFQKMLDQKPGNLVTLAGNNQKKTEYILACIKAGLNVLSDKPMAIQPSDFEQLKEAYAIAGEKGLLLYDIMTERYEIATILQREFSQQQEIFGELQKGTRENPAITKESVHHFSKVISGIPLIRPEWFFDIRQEGEAIADVGTHLVDLIQWEAFPGEAINYEEEIRIIESKRWPTPLSIEEYNGVTGKDTFPSFLGDYIENDVLMVESNSSLLYQVRGVHALVSVEWKYKAPQGAADTHYSIMRGTLCDLIIKQGKEENYVPTLYIRAADPSYADQLRGKIDIYLTGKLQKDYPGIAFEEMESGSWRLAIPKRYHIGHEAHFEQVTLKFLRYMKEGRIPDLEVRNMLAKYYTTTMAVELATKR